MKLMKNQFFLGFTEDDYNLLQNSYKIFSKGNAGIIQSVVSTINALQAASMSPTFNVAGDTLGKNRLYLCFSVYIVVMCI